MNELSKVVDALVSIIKSSSDFAATNLPDIAHQAVAWEIQSSQIWMWFGIVMVVIGLISIIMDLIYDFSSGAALLGFLMAVAFSLVAVSSFLDIKRAETAPKVFLLDYFSNKISRLEGGCKK